MKIWERVTIIEKNSKLFDLKIGKLSNRNAVIPPYFDYDKQTKQFVFIGYYEK
ncbi:hypothetical protein [Ilyobacter polytropus]|jgi:hypothetical protein|uniref:Uncharacterized protein n=1 Tax=Ilyobacter polytropus (strain ATCC 51220 / DSM 2926 / LMG 16218 / CuHBu1) TaxID=572544 RepID=E3HBC1_ILYPC|nr:hypothetical protein [Ilyobacter polytropus]ADO83736.1 hypothetical protein Ilyop_1965 [Ilyobacter polytropus DSM 2926]